MKMAQNMPVVIILALSFVFAAALATAEVGAEAKGGEKPALPPDTGIGDLSSSKLTTAITGTWTWISDMTVIVREDNSLEVIDDLSHEKINEGKWELVDQTSRTYRFVYQNGNWIDTLTLSPDGRILDGTNNEGLSIRGTKR
ncbi:MAG: hypothetical protein OEW15_06495 [Nitrospirota bacterium]|nr:hypothetical protein [Nitrospirota bacterium]